MVYMTQAMKRRFRFRLSRLFAGSDRLDEMHDCFPLLRLGTWGPAGLVPLSFWMMTYDDIPYLLMLLGLDIWDLDDATHWVRLVWGPKKRHTPMIGLGWITMTKTKKRAGSLDETSS